MASNLGHALPYALALIVVLWLGSLKWDWRNVGIIAGYGLLWLIMCVGAYNLSKRIHHDRHGDE